MDDGHFHRFVCWLERNPVRQSTSNRFINCNSLHLFPIYARTMSSKVPIPAIPSNTPNPRRRTTRACDACRACKRKCDGKMPTCSQCQAQGSEDCFYSDKKNVRQRKELCSANQRTEHYEDLLRDLLLAVDEQYAARITDALEVPSPCWLRRSPLNSRITWKANLLKAMTYM